MSSNNPRAIYKQKWGKHRFSVGVDHSSFVLACVPNFRYFKADTLSRAQTRE